MERKVYEVLVKNNSNKYILGRVSGIIRGLMMRKDADNYPQVIVQLHPEQTIVKVETTRWNYLRMKKRIEKCYPSLCVFE